MKYTNKEGFPEYVKEWLQFDEYDYIPNTFSATTLMRPPRQYALMARHWDKLEQDLADVIALRYGTAIHDSVEKVPLTNCIQEERYKTLVGTSIVTGKADIILKEGEEYQLIDVKSTSAWTFIFGSKDEDYVKQLSVYRFLGRRNGLHITQDAKIWMIFTDWSKSKATKDPNYPQTRIKIKDIELWDDETTVKWIQERIHELQAAESIENDKDLPECTPEELWQTETKYALMKQGRKTALKLYDNEKDAEVAWDGDSDKYVEKRPGMVKRCGYCPCREVCEQHTKLKAQGLIEG